MMQFTTVYGCMIENGCDPPVAPMVTSVVVVVVTLIPLKLVSMDAAFILTLGAVEEYTFAPLAPFANEFPWGVLAFGSAFTALSVEVAVAPGATVEVEVEVAVAG